MGFWGCDGSQATSNTLTDLISEAATHVTYMKQGTSGRCQDRQVYMGYQKVFFFYVGILNSSW